MAKKITPLCPMEYGLRNLVRSESPSFSGPLAKKLPPLTKYLKQSPFLCSIFGHGASGKETQGKHGEVVLPAAYDLPAPEKLDRNGHLYTMKKIILLIIISCFVKAFSFGQTCPTAMDTLNINEVSALILNAGDLHWNYNTQTSWYEVPQGSGKHSIYASALGMSGFDQGGQLHGAAMQYGHGSGNCDFFSGPINAANPSAFDKIWKVNRYKVEEFKYEWALGNVQNATYTPDSNILTWPAIVDTSYAHFVDVNGNGIYDPLTGGDYPKIKGDQCLYWIMNDQGIHGSGCSQLGVEIHSSAYEYTCPQIADSEQVINYTTLYHYEIFNRSTFQYDSVYLGYWQDTDLGDYVDDYVGCYPQGNYGYVYNADSIDGGSTQGYGLRPPMLSTVILNGPLANSGDGIDNDNDGIIDEPGEKNLMTHFVYFTNSAVFPQSNPINCIEYYNYLRGMWQDGTPFTYGGTGYGGSTATNFCFPDFPYDTSGWNEITTGFFPNDRRFLISSGPFTFLPGTKTDFNFAIVWSRDTTLPYLSQAFFDKNLKDNQKIQQWFAADSFPSCLQINLGVNEENINVNVLAISPNPSSEFISVTYKSKTKNPQFEILDLMGRKLISTQQNLIDVSKLPQGLYLVNIRDGDSVFSKRFVKE